MTCKDCQRMADTLRRIGPVLSGLDMMLDRQRFRSELQKMMHEVDEELAGMNHRLDEFDRGATQ